MPRPTGGLLDDLSTWGSPVRLPFVFLGIIIMGAGAKGVLPAIVVVPVIFAVFAVLTMPFWRRIWPGG